jgi:VWFA-related protein
MFTAVAAMSAVVVLGQNDSAAQETPIFKSDVALVKVDAEVTDGTKLLGGFQKDDFRILDNGTERAILYFSQSEEPLDLILLFDLSGSMIPKLKKLSESAHAALAELRNGDRVSVMVLGSKSRVVLPYTEDLNTVEMAINGVTAMRMGGTRILAAINDAAMLFMKEQRTQRRRAVVTVTGKA